MKFALMQIGLFWMLNPMAHGEPAFEGSRLFMTHEQRELIDSQLADQNNENTVLERVNATIGIAMENIADSNDKPVVLSAYKTLSFDGLVVRPHDNSAVLWVNGKMKSPGKVHRIDGERVRIFGHGVSHVMSPGQIKRIKTRVGKSDG